MCGITRLKLPVFRLNKEECLMVTTKDQERNTLEKTKKMVAELGENSYI